MAENINRNLLTSGGWGVVRWEAGPTDSRRKTAQKDENTHETDDAFK